MLKYRLAVVTTHPIQYQAPLFRKLALSPQIDLMVYFCSNPGLKGRIDPGFNLPVTWDVPLLEHYPHRFLSNFSWRFIPRPENFWSCLNPGIIPEILKGRYDAVLIHGYSLATHWLAFLTAYFCGLPILLHGETVLHSSSSDFWGVKKRILSKLFRKITAFLYIGTRSRQFYESFGIPQKQLFFCPYSVDNDFFKKLHPRADKESIRKKLRIPEKKPVILYAAKFIPRKRPQDCLKAFERISDKASLVMVGDGALRSELTEYAAAKKIPRVFFAGFKNQTEIADFYALADVFVLPSFFEPWGVVVNEAMCFGLPVITTDGVASAADLVRHRENGFVYPAGDIDRLSNYLNVLVSSPSERKRMGERSFQMISNWNYDCCVDNILAALEYARRLEP